MNLPSYIDKEKFKALQKFNKENNFDINLEEVVQGMHSNFLKLNSLTEESYQNYIDTNND